MDDDPSHLTITARGPRAAGRLPLGEVARLCGEFQQTLERIALSLYGATSVTGRRPKDVVEAVRVEFTGFREGSAVLELELPVAPDGGELVSEALDVLAAGSLAVRDSGPLPEAFTPSVLAGLLRFSGGLADGGLTDILVSRAGHPLVIADLRFREGLKTLQRDVRRAETTIVGLLQMGDFAPSALRCRVDTIHASVACTFDGSLSDTVLSCLNGLVVASGTGEFAVSGGTLRSMDLTHVEPLSRPPETSLDELAEAQQVMPWSYETAEKFGPKESMPDEDFEAFMAGALSARGER